MTLKSASAKTAYLILADGTVMKGKSFGCEGKTIGEVVFTTSMVGYQETLSDPNYCGQIVTQTFPLIGNYGTNENDYASDYVAVNGFIVREYCEAPSNFRCEGDIDTLLKKHGVIGLFDIDTRALTRIIREKGVMNGMITTEEATEEYVAKVLPEIKSCEIKNAVEKVSTKEVKEIKSEKGTYKVALIDYGVRNTIISSLLARNCDITVYPYDTAAKTILDTKPDGIMLSNGPADPKECAESVEALKEIAKSDIPVFAIGLGHQLLALAMGGDTAKTKYGHRGASQPVTDIEIGRTFVTTQNRGYTVINESISDSVGTVSHVNGNDKTCEGIEYKNGKMFSVQFQPENGAKKCDTSYLYDKFVSIMEGNK